MKRQTQAKLRTKKTSPRGDDQGLGWGLDQSAKRRKHCIYPLGSFLANPDLPRRFELGADLNVPDRATMFGGGEKGYIDYPALG